MKFFRQLLVIPAALSIAVPVTADINSEDSKIDSDSLQITVTGTRNEKFVDDVPSSIDVIDLSDKRYSGFYELKDLFRYEPGVSVEIDSTNYSAAAATEGNVNIRGMDLNRILFIQDGIRLPAAFGDSLGYNYDRGDFVDFNTLKAIEIVKGPGSTLYGSDALGGIVSFRSLEANDLLKPGQDFAIEIPANYTGFNNGKFGAVKIATKNEDTGFSAVGVISYLNSQEKKPKDFDDRDDWINDVERTGNSYYLNVKKDIGDNKNIGVNIERVKRNTESSRPANTLGDFRPFGFPIYYTSQIQDVDVTKDRVVLSYSYENENVDKGVNSLIAKGYYQNAETDDVWKDTGFRFFQPTFRLSDYQVRDESYGVDIQMGSKIDNHKLTYGITSSKTSNEYLQLRDTTNLNTNISTNSDTKRFPDGDTKRFGIFLQDELRIGKVDVIAGIRYEKTQVDVSSDALHTDYCTGGGDYDCNLGEIDVDSFTPKIGGILDLNPNVSVYGQYAMGFKTPTWSQMNAIQTNLGGNSPYQQRPNSSLDPEKSHSYEVGLRSKTERNQFRLATFYNKYEDFIARKDLGFDTVSGVPNVSISSFANSEEAKIWGIELNNDFTLTDSDNGKVAIINAVSYLKGEDEKTDEPLPGIDPFKLVTGIRYDAPGDKFNTELIATYTGKATLPDSDTFFNPEAVTIFDLVGTYNINDDFTVDLGVYNLADKRHYKYQNTRSARDTATALERYSEPGRSVKAGFNFRF